MSAEGEKVVENEKKEVPEETTPEKSTEGNSMQGWDNTQRPFPKRINFSLHGHSGRIGRKVFMDRYDKKLPRGQQVYSIFAFIYFVVSITPKT